MKKTIMTLCLLATLPLVSSAQQWLTVKTGGGISTAIGPAGITPGLATTFGLGYKHQLSNRLIAEGNILLDGRSMSYPTGVPDANDQMIYFLAGGSYVQVPLTIQYKIPFRKKELKPYRTGQPSSYFFIEGGPYLSYGLAVTPFLDASIIASYEGGDDSITLAQQEPRKLDVGIVAGMGVNFKLGDKGKYRLSVGTRANYCMLNVYKDTRLGTSSNFSAVGYLALDINLTKRKHIKHRW
jgi:hypothetical protein